MQSCYCTPYIWSRPCQIVLVIYILPHYITFKCHIYICHIPAIPAHSWRLRVDTFIPANAMQCPFCRNNNNASKILHSFHLYIPPCFLISSDWFILMLCTICLKNAFISSIPFLAECDCLSCYSIGILDCCFLKGHLGSYDQTISD